MAPSTPSAPSSPHGWSARAVALGVPAGWTILLVPLGAVAVALLGAVVEPLLLRPFYRRAEEYQLLVTFGLLLILEDVIRLIWGGLPLSADPAWTRCRAYASAASSIPATTSW